MELRRYWEIVCRRKWILAGTALLIPLISYCIIENATRIYETEGILLVKAKNLQTGLISNLPDGLGTLSFIDVDNAIGTIERILGSDSMAIYLIEEIDLRDRRGNLLNVDNFVNPNRLRLLLQKKGVRVRQVADSETFSVTGYSTNPEEAAKIAEMTIAFFVDTLSEMYKESVRDAITVIEARVKDAEQSLHSREQALVDYKKEHKIFNIDTQIKTLIDEISALEAERNQTLRSLDENNNSLKTIRESSMTQKMVFKDEVTYLGEILVTADYKGELLDLETKLERQKVDLTPEHPDVKITKHQIEKIRDLLKKEITKSFASQIIERPSFYDNLSEKYGNAILSIVSLKARESVLVEQIKERRSNLARFPMLQMELQALSRKATNLEKEYNVLFSDLEKAKTAEKLNLTNSFLIHSPTLSQDIRDNLYFPPKKKAFQLIGTGIVGLFLGIFFIFLLEYLDDSIWNIRDIEEKTGTMFLGIVPKVRKKERSIRRLEGSALAEAAFNVLSSMLFVKRKKPSRTIALVSPSRKTGKSLLTAFFAGFLANQGQKVIVIDANFRSPAQHTLLGLPNHTGLSDYFLRNIEIDKIISHGPVENLDAIGCGSLRVDFPQKHLGSTRFSVLLESLAKDYDMILIDTPAHSLGNDAMLVSSLSDAVFCIVSQGETHRAVLQSFFRAAGQANIEIAGFVLNKVVTK